MSNVWVDRYMKSRCEVTEHSIFIQGDKILDIFPASIDIHFVIGSHTDSFQVCARDKNYHSPPDFSELVYAGTRDNCEKVAAHLNSILRQAEAMVNNE